ncbi:MAG: peptidylprolyl isomerase [Gemmatimonadales bacterium]
MRTTRSVRTSALALSLVFAACAGEGDGDEARGVDEAEPGQPTAEPAEGSQPTNPLLNPASEAMNQTAPDVFQARFETSKGDFTIEVHRDWAPNGADRFYNLVSNGFYDDVRFFRVLDGFMAQFGISGDPQVSAVWRVLAIPDDPVVESNTRGYFAPFGVVVSGMDVVDQLHSGYGEGAPRGAGPSQGRIQAEGNAYLESEFPRLDYVERAFIIDDAAGD